MFPNLSWDYLSNFSTKFQNGLQVLESTSNLLFVH